MATSKFKVLRTLNLLVDIFTQFFVNNMWLTMDNDDGLYRESSCTIVHHREILLLSR